MQKRLFILIFFFLGLAKGFSQLNVNLESNANLIIKFESLPQESIALHYNSNVLFTGERFLYSIYCRNTKDGSLSEFSQIAYVELVAENGTSILRQKVKLAGGRGYGDFYISSDQPTGSYKLVAYTRWMKNFGVTSFYKTDLAIVNPYRKIPQKYRITENDSLQSLSDNSRVISKGLSPIRSEKIRLELQDSVVGRRRLVSLQLQKMDSAVGGGSYSLSVAKRNDLFPNWSNISENFITKSKQINSRFDSDTLVFSTGTTYNQTFYLPELRGELLSGRVLSTATNLPIKECTVALSIAGKDYLLKTATTNGQGQFL